MHGHHGVDARKFRVAVGVPDGARQRLRMQMRVGAVGADQRLPAREELVFGDLRVFGLVDLRRSARDRENASDDFLVGIAL